MKFKLLETISSYIKNPENKVLVISDPDTSVARKLVEKYCKKYGLKKSYDLQGVSFEKIQIPYSISDNTKRLFAEGDILISDFVSEWSKDRFDEIMDEALKCRQELKKPLILIGWFDENQVNKFVEEGKVIADTVNYDVWMQWAKKPNEKGKSNIHSWVISFLEKHPEYWFIQTNNVIQIHPMTWNGVSASLLNLRELDEKEELTIDKIRQIAAPHIGHPMADIFAEYVQELKNN